MGAAIIPAREIVESIYTKSASEEEKTKRIGKYSVPQKVAGA